MICVYCGGKTKTINSRGRMGQIHTWRRRQCLECKAVFTTNESIDLERAIRVRTNKGLAPFIYEKLFSDVYEALSHRKNAHMDAKSLTDTVISKALPRRSGIIKSAEIKETVLEVLSRFDKAAFTYFQAHHPTS